MSRRVLIALHEEVLGGATLSVLRCAPILEQSGWELSYWAPRPGEVFDQLAARGRDVAGAERLLATSLDVLRLPPGPAQRLRATPGYLRAFRSQVRATGADLVHANSLVTLAEAATARSAGARVVMHLHEMMPAGRKGAWRPDSPTASPTRWWRSRARAPARGPSAAGSRGSCTRGAGCRPTRPRCPMARRPSSARSASSRGARESTSSATRPRSCAAAAPTWTFASSAPPPTPSTPNGARRARPGPAAGIRHLPRADVRQRARLLGCLRPRLAPRPVPDLDARGDGARPCR